ncbi:MAG: hypothetical protein VKK62_02705 [Synechococcaceae cyanobacterium]|nr:hypothetical protein [Synechococcaceae cyanobacterium]
MGEIADALRSNLRQLAQADARLLRELDAVLPPDGLDALTVPELRQRCKEGGLKGYSGLKKPELLARLRAASGAPPGGTVAAAATGAPRPGPGSAIASAPTAGSRPGQDSLEARLDRLEALLRRIAEHLGVT